MTQDCSNPLSVSPVECKSIPEGIRVVGVEKRSAPNVQTVFQGERNQTDKTTAEKSSSWSYLFLQHMAAQTFRKWLDKYNARKDIPSPQPYFVHQSYRYCYKNQKEERGVRRVLEPSVSGLVFLQGTVRDLQSFLRCNFPQYHLVNDCSKHAPASIEDSVMQPFMKVMKAHPEQVTFLRDPFEKFVKDHTRLRVLTGVFKGYEGYLVRINRDRQLVFDFAGYAVAIRGVHREDFEIVE